MVFSFIFNNNYSKARIIWMKSVKKMFQVSSLVNLLRFQETHLHYNIVYGFFQSVSSRLLRLVWRSYFHFQRHGWYSHFLVDPLLPWRWVLPCCSLSHSRMDHHYLVHLVPSSYCQWGHCRQIMWLVLEWRGMPRGSPFFIPKSSAESVKTVIENPEQILMYWDLAPTKIFLFNSSVESNVGS